MTRYLPLLLILLLLGACTDKRVTIRSNPMPAQVYIDAEPVGSTPYEFVTPTYDKMVDIRVVKDSYVSASRTISLKDDTALTLDFELEPLEHEELVVFISDPAGAYVTRNDEFLCETPCEYGFSDIDPKDRITLKITKRGFETKLVRVRYKGDDWREDNFADEYRVVLSAEAGARQPEPTRASQLAPGRPVVLPVTPGGIGSP